MRERPASEYAMSIAQIGINDGGLGLLNASNRAAPDFVLTMAAAMRYAQGGFHYNKDLEPILLHPSINDLFNPATNEDSVFLARFDLLVAHIAEAAVSDKCPQAERRGHFLEKISSNSARSRLKKHCNAMQVATLYNLVGHKYPMHLHHLPSILSPQTSPCLVAMSRSIPSHRLRNWNFLYGILRKLRLPIYDPTDCPTCWCGTIHDCFGDHAFCCKKINKKMAHNFI
ncbi:hypothetical protein ACHAXR_000301, partial [Thalassiosira sp. AJA248-18]